MFQPGDLVVYGTTGVCRVEDITTPSGAEAGKVYYLLKPLYQNGTVYTPVEHGKIPIRPILTETEATALIDAMPSVAPQTISGTTMQAVSAQYQEALRQNDCQSRLQLLKYIYEKQHPDTPGKQRVSSLDERFRKQCEQLLYGELAVSLGISMEEVPAYIEKRLKQKR